MTRLERKNALALIDAAASGDLDAIKSLLEGGIDPSLMIRHPNWGKTTALIVAIESKHFIIAHRLVEGGADVHFSPPEGGDNAQLAPFVPGGLGWTMNRSGKHWRN